MGEVICCFICHLGKEVALSAFALAFKMPASFISFQDVLLRPKDNTKLCRNISTSIIYMKIHKRCWKWLQLDQFVEQLESSSLCEPVDSDDTATALAAATNQSSTPFWTTWYLREKCQCDLGHSVTCQMCDRHLCANICAMFVNIIRAFVGRAFVGTHC